MGLSTRLSAIQQTTTSVSPEIQYQVREPRNRSPKISSRGTLMPSGPPVSQASLVSTMAIRMPMPSVATAR